MANHTHGPWTLDGRSVIGRAFDESARCIVERVRGGSPEAADANARLIVAAPELLDACKEAYLFIGGRAANPAVGVPLRAAIKRADPVWLDERDAEGR